MTSAPQSKICLAEKGRIPLPSAEFSPLTNIKSGRYCSFSWGIFCRKKSQPACPTTSPTAKTRIFTPLSTATIYPDRERACLRQAPKHLIRQLFCVFDGTALPLAEAGVALAHCDGGVPNLRVDIDRVDAYGVGGLLYFFERACGISGYLLGVNPFDQPGVEAYKRNMYALLDKPGYEEEGRRLRERLKER